MGKWITGIIGSLLILFIAAGLILYFTDNRYSLSIKSYNTLKKATSMDLSFESKMGMGENSIGITGETQLTTSPKASLTQVSMVLPILGNLNIMDVYTSEDKIFHKYNLSFLPWQEGMPILQEDAFNPAMFSELDMNVELLDLLKFASVLDKGSEGELLEYYTTDYFTVEEFKTMLVRFLKLDEAQVENWNITAYRISFAFNKEMKELDKISIAFDHDISEVALNNQFILTFHELNSISDIPVPEGLSLSQP
jgi:hypothetical protein